MVEILAENFVGGLLGISVQAAVIFCVLILARVLFSLCRMPGKYACLLWLVLFIRLLMPVQPESPLGLWTKGGVQAVSVEDWMGYSDQAAGGSESIREEMQGIGNTDVTEQQGNGKTNAPMEAQESENRTVSQEQQENGNIGVPMSSQKGQQGADNLYVPGALYGAGAVHKLEKLTGAKNMGIILFLIWGTGCLGCLLYGGISCFLLKRKLRCSIKGEDNCYLTDGIPTAFVMGIFSPKIYLPSELCGADLSYVMLHERMHIKRGDHLTKTAVYLIASIYWFHPLVWTALFFLGRDMELSCDEAVLRVLGEDGRRAYADTLLRLSDGRSYSAGIPIAFGEGDTKNRIRHIIRYKKPMGVTAVIAAVTLSGLAVCLLTGRSAENGGQSSESAETPSENGSQGGESADSHSEESRRGDVRDEGSLPASVNGRFPEPLELPSGHTVTVTGDAYHITMAINGEAYKMEDLCGEVNALEDIREFGKYIVITGHISPDMAYYGFYDIESRQWELELTGSFLTWDENWERLDEPIESVIYAESADDQGVIRDWKTNTIAVFDLEEEYIYDLKREGNDITVTIVDYEGGKKELQLDLADPFY